MLNRTHPGEPERDIGSDFDTHRYGGDVRFRGPREDGEILAELRDRLATQFANAHVDVSVSHGGVALSGSVTDEEQKHAIIELAEAVVGVTIVHDRLAVALSDDETKPG